MAEKDQMKKLQSKVEELEAERRGLLESLKGCEDRLRFIYDSSPLGMGFIDMEGVLSDCNTALADILGASRDQLIGFKMRTGIRDEGLAVAIARAFSGTVGAFEGDYTTTLSKRKIALRAIFTPLFGREGEQTGVLFIAENISERKSVEDRLRDSEHRYKAIVESQAEFVVRYRPGGILTFVNDTLCRYLGMKREDLLGRSYYPFMHPEDREAFIRKIEALDKSDPSMLAEARVVLPDGKVVWHRWTHHAIFDEVGKPVEYQSTGRDVTELKETEDRLRESEERYRQLYEAESDAIFLIDNGTGRILMANSAAAALYGYSVEELLSMHNTALSMEPAETRKVTVETPVLKDNVVNIPLRYHRRKDGTVFPVEVTGRFFHLRNRPVHIAAIRDISRRRESEEAVRRQAELLELTHDAIFVRDAEDRIIFWNRGAESCYGWTADEALGQVSHELLRTRFPVPLKDILNEVHEKGFWDGVLEHQAKDGRHMTVLSRWSLRRAQEEIPYGILELNVDISDRKRVEDALRESEQKYKFLVETTNTGFVVLDAAGSVLDANDVYVRLSGHDRQRDILGRNVAEWTAAHDGDRDAAVKKCIEQGFVRNLEIDYVHRDGTLVPVEINATVMRDEGEVRIFGLCRDISERKRNENILRESEAMLQQSQRVAHLGHYVFDVPSGRWSASATLEEVFGIDRDHPRDVDGWLRIVHAEQREEMAGYLRDDVLRDRKPFDREYRITRPSDGADRWVHGLGKLEFDRAGRPVRMFGTIQDITDAKRAEEALKEGEAKYRRLYNDTPVLLHSIDRNGVLVEVNDHWLKILGYERQEVIGRKVTDFYTEESRKYAQEIVQPSFFRDGIARNISYQFVKKNGEVLEVLLSATGERDAEGRVVRSQAVIEDITGRKRMEEELRESEERFRAITTTASDAILLMDDAGKIVYWNPAADRIFGYSSDEALGRDLHEFLAPPRLHNGYRKGFARFIQTGQGPVIDKSVEMVAMRKDGTEFPIEISTSAMNISDKWHALGIVRDISERKRLEEELLKTQKLESIGTLAGGIAHDFNNLLQGVFGYISMAQMHLDQKPKALAMLDQAQQALEQSVNLTSQLLTFSKGGKPVKQVVDLRPVIETSVKFALSGSRVEPVLSVAPDLHAVEADPGQLAQVLQNIVLNADQAMPLGGKVEITARNISLTDAPYLPGLETKDIVEITVRDEGTGIPADHMARIFDPYFTTKEKGSGLGLATSYAIVKNHGGTLSAASELGKGTTFVIQLPASAQTPGSSVMAAAPGALQKGRVLVMDDEEMIRKVAEELLRELGQEVLCVEHGSAAIDAYRRARDSGRPFDVVILDLTVRGGMGGAEALTRLREIDPDVRAVVSSGYSDDEVVSNFRKFGFRAFLKKPYDLTSLRTMLNEFLA